MLHTARRHVFSIAAIAVAASTLTACTYSVAGGLIGGLSTLLAIGALLLFTSTQQGCDDPVTQPCLSPPPDIDAAVEPDVGPCLTVLIDAGPDGGDDDAQIGPCLDVRPDAGTDAGPPGAPGAPGPLDGTGETGAARSPGDARADLLDRLAHRLPADVVARLRADGEDDRE